MKRLLLMALVGTGAAGTAYAVTQLEEPPIESTDEIEGPTVNIKDEKVTYTSNNVTFEVEDADKFCVNTVDNSEGCTWNEFTFDDGTTDNVTITLDDGINYVYFKDSEEKISEAIEVTVDKDVTLITINPLNLGTVANTDPAVNFTLYFSIYDHGNTITVTNSMLTWEDGTDLLVEGQYDLTITYIDSVGETKTASITFTIDTNYQG